MRDHRRTFSREFKVAAVKRVLEEGQSIRSVAYDLNVAKSAVGRWVQAYKADPEHSFPGSGRMKAEEGELRRLRRRVHELEQELDFVKKAEAFFAKRRK